MQTRQDLKGEGAREDDAQQTQTLLEKEMTSLALLFCFCQNESGLIHIQTKIVYTRGSAEGFVIMKYERKKYSFLCLNVPKT